MAQNLKQSYQRAHAALHMNSELDFITKRLKMKAQVRTILYYILI